MRNRLMGAVAVVAVAVVGAGAPGISAAVDDTHTSQRLVDLAQLDARAIALSHSLADERDTMTSYVATGRGGSTAAGYEALRARVDRQLRDLRAASQGASGETAVYAAAEKQLSGLPQIRQEALAGPATAQSTYEAYTRTLQALGAIADDIARSLPGRADGADADTRALPALGRAVEQAAGTRALLLAALRAGGEQPQLSAAAQLAHLREQGSLADFTQVAGERTQDRYDATVNGADVTTAERYLTRLTDQPRMDAADMALSRSRVQATLTARIDLMRGVESALATQEIQRLSDLRDDDVTALEVRIALVGVCLLLALGVSISAARSMTRPLAALRLGAKRVAADPAHEEPIAFKGRNDEFAAAVRSVNALHAQVAAVARRTAELEGERGRLITARQRLADEREVLDGERDALRAEVGELTERLATLRTGVHGRYVNLALRTVGLVERQLHVIESMEEQEQDPEALETLFKLDHFAAQMRRNSENLLVLAGTEHGTGHPGPVPLLDVLRASVSEIERYDRVIIQSLPPHAQIAGFAADDLSHLVAELLENATAFSPPEAHVELSGWLLETGELMLSVQDEGIGMTAERLAELNERLADAEAASTSESIDEALGLGLYVVVRLAARHGVRVQLRAQQQGGVTAVVVLPGSILPTRPGPVNTRAGTPVSAGPTLPGSVAEANSNALQTRVPRTDQTALPKRGAGPAQPAVAPAPQADPLVAAAERAIDAAGLPDRGVPTDRNPAAQAPTGPQMPRDPQVRAPQAPAQAPRTQIAPQAQAPGTARAPQVQAPQAPGPQAPVAPVVPDAASGRPAPAGPVAPYVEAPAAPQVQAPQAPAAPQAPVGGSPYGPMSSGPYGEPGTGSHRRPAEPAAPADPYAIGPDQHTRPAPAAEPAQAAAPHAEATAPGAGEQSAVPEQRRTDLGLPKRTPKIVAPKENAAAPRKTGKANAEALRRRLGGFQQGARSGRREVEAEFGGRPEGPGGAAQPAAPQDRAAQQTSSQMDTGGAGAPGMSHVVEEARD
ncbi:nitrate- and nitrite sensing domain-containing protein [Streptomyces sp. NBC_01525]|uniref:sensor histidine kinase n=1 Tax=Streptomyces sp. NBC_01525 TaxID=2903893 RepID=UPI00386E35C5